MKNRKKYNIYIYIYIYIYNKLLKLNDINKFYNIKLQHKTFKKGLSNWY